MMMTHWELNICYILVFFISVNSIAITLSPHLATVKLPFSSLRVTHQKVDSLITILTSIFPFRFISSASLLTLGFICIDLRMEKLQAALEVVFKLMSLSTYTIKLKISCWFMRYPQLVSCATSKSLPIYFQKEDQYHYLLSISCFKHLSERELKRLYHYQK